ncbi:MAG: hypothetical protein CMJ78_13015 [Planctomycetaceae bacterium]|nr:hypothetical protein [Planctomycetaceae bacterium]
MDGGGVLQSIRELLVKENIEFRELHHEPTRTSEDSARARGEDLRIGGKALLMKIAKQFSLFVLPADRRVDSFLIRSRLGTRKMRFANADELFDLTKSVNDRDQQLTGLVPGSVPPFGQPVLPFDLYVDSGICENERIAFNAGSLTDSVIMKVEDYLRIARPLDVFSFSAKPDEA